MKTAVFWTLIALTMEAANTSETSVNFYQTKRRNNPEDSHLQSVGIIFGRQVSTFSTVACINYIVYCRYSVIRDVRMAVSVQIGTDIHTITKTGRKVGLPFDCTLFYSTNCLQLVTKYYN
jgi:hypothetical protein